MHQSAAHPERLPLEGCSRGGARDDPADQGFRERVDALTQRLRSLHPYELPEILVLDIDAERSLAEYVNWVRTECAPG